MRGADTLLIRLWQDPEAQLIQESPAEGDHFYYAVTSDFGNSSLTRAFDLTEVNSAWLEYKVWYDLDKDSEYGYVTVSNDGGLTWETVSGNFTRKSQVFEDYYDEGYTFRSGNWRTDHIDLREYAPGRLLLRFEVMSAIATSYGGMAIDDLYIKAIGFHDGFESPDDGWVANGWIRTDNRLPNNTWLQAVQDTGGGLHVSRSLVSGRGDLSVDIVPGVSQVLVAVSPVVPRTSVRTDYELSFYLMNAAGEVMVVARECTVTTTHVLNFRASPNGNKIGLVPKAATLDALDRQGDWFMVEYAGVPGWISADYVQTAGNCP